MNYLKKLLQYPVMLAFFLFIGLFTVYDLTQTNREYSEFENKYLAQKPPFTMKAFLSNEWTQDYETYINDQFVRRDDWITIKSMAETLLLKIENNGIAYGSDGYMFEKFQSITGDQFQRNLDYMMQFVQAHPQDHITLSLIPNAYMILPDKLPEGLVNVDQSAVITDVTQQVNDLGTTAAAVDFTDALSRHSDEYIYYRTDHHWTTLGAYYAYAEYVRSLGMEPAELSQLEGQEVSGFYGTYFSKAKKFNAIPDTITYYTIPDAGVTVDGEEKDGFYDLEKFQVRDKYAAFLWGNNGYTVLKSGVRTPAEGEGPSRILVIKDSYANSFVPFLLYNFDEVHVVDLRYSAESVSALLEDGAFDQVLLMYNFMNLVTDTNIYKLNY
ncbi:MAG: hypothetical protein KH009_00445 [Clostridiales bacterium]|nr:hypothetical protein [Clostridiales bacterium]